MSFSPTVPFDDEWAISQSTRPNTTLRPFWLSETMTRFSFLAVATIVFTASVQAHVYIMRPAASYKNETAKTFFDTKINDTINPAFHGKKWNDRNPANNARAFDAAFQASSLKTLRELLDPVVPTCANTRIDVPPIAVWNITGVAFHNEQYHEGFVHTHDGPCELWINETRVFHAPDCAHRFHDDPATIPINYRVCPCGQPCILTFYWLALHEAQWQVYKQCVPIIRDHQLPLGLCL